MRHSQSIEYPLGELIFIERDCNDPRYIGRDQEENYLSRHTVSKGASKNRESSSTLVEE